MYFLLFENLINNTNPTKFQNIFQDTWFHVIFFNISSLIIQPIGIPSKESILNKFITTQFNNFFHLIKVPSYLIASEYYLKTFY